MRRLLIVLFTAVVSLPAAAEDKPKLDADQWQLMTMGGKRIGFAAATEKKIKDESGKTLTWRETILHMSFKRFGQKIALKVTNRTWETAAGELVKAEMITENPPATASKVLAVREGDKLKVTSTVDGKSSVKTLDWKKDAKSEGWIEKQFKNRKFKKGDTVEAMTWNNQLASFVETSVTIEGREKVKRYTGKEVELWKAKMTIKGFPLTSYLYIDDKGEALLTKVDVAGQTMVSESVPAKVALAKVAGDELDIAVKTLIKVGKIENAGKRKSITYRVTVPGEDASKLLPHSRFQQVKKDGDVALVTVKRVQLPKSAKVKKSPGKEFLAPNKYIQSDDELVMKLAKEAVADLETKDAASITRALEKYVAKKVTNKNFSTNLASAAEVARTCEGDCTEHSVLLAALLRAHKIPSRVAVGFVYVRSLGAFGGHMWTEAWLDGKWYPIDGVIGAGGTLVGHLKLLDASFADDGPLPTTVFIPIIKSLGRMQVEVVKD